MTATTPIDPCLCPLCGQPNGCAMAQHRPDPSGTAQTPPPCWCTEVRFEPSLLARIPESARRRACVCRSCATSAQPGGSPV